MSGEGETSLAVAELPLPVKESVLKKRKRDEQWALVRKQRQDVAKAKARSSGQGTFKRAEQYVKEFRQQERDFLRFKREAKKVKTVPKYLEIGESLLFVIRIRGTTDLHPKTKKILQWLRLRQIFSGVFLRANKDTLSMLRKVEPYVTYGYPSMKSVKELIYKRGHGKVNKSRTPLTDNAIIEEALGKFSIICIPDLINEIFRVGPHFKEANEFLWPFKLAPPSGSEKKPGSYFTEIGDSGNRKEKINDLIAQMN